MTLFDPYSHSRIQELRNEQLARKNTRRRELQIDTPRSTDHHWLRQTVRRIALSSAAKPVAAESRPSARPALDS